MNHATQCNYMRVDVILPHGNAMMLYSISGIIARQSIAILAMPPA